MEDTEKRILICDPDKAVRDLAKDALFEHFPRSTVVEASSEGEAHGKCERQRFDLVVLTLETRAGRKDPLRSASEILGMPARVRPKALLILSSSIDPKIVASLGNEVRGLAKPCSSALLGTTIAASLGTKS